MAKKNRHRKSNSDSMVEINSSELSDDAESSSSSSSSSSSKQCPFNYNEIKVNN